MCGIVGFTCSARRPDTEFVRRITHSLSHRGPDQEGVYVSDGVALGAVRLKIIDLKGGDQPMVSDDGKTVLAYNGEVYNYREVRRALESRGHSFRTESDTEVVLRAFLEWDTACFERLNGMFALAFWQEPRRRLVLARDRMGIKPLYLCRRAGRIYFGSELKALFAHAEIARSLDLTALEQYLSLNYVPAPLTLVEGIEKLLPGHFLEWSGGDAAVRPYWKVHFEPDLSLTEGEAAEQLETHLRRAVKRQLVSDVPLGVLLSGGIDSSTIVHFASQEREGKLQTFSISFAGRSFDEGRYFRAVARHYSTEHHEFDLSRNLELEETVRQFADYADEPCGDSSSLPVWYLSKLCRRHVTVALSGEGADELLGGYLTYQADRLASVARAVPAPFRQAALAVTRLLPVSDDKISLEYMAKRFLEGTLLPSPFEAHTYWNGAFSGEQRRRLCAFRQDQPWQVDALVDGARSLGPLNRFLCFDQRFYLADDILAKVDRMSMAHSLEVRPPFLDHEVVEFAARLPESLKIRGREQKYLLKRLMRGRLPAEVLKRKKIGFDIPAHDWLRRELKPLLLDVMSPAAVARTGILHVPEAQNLMRAHLEGRINLGFQLWGLMILLLWMDRWHIQSPFPPAQLLRSAPAETGSRIH